MDRRAIRLQLKKALAAAKRDPLGGGRTDAAGGTGLRPRRPVGPGRRFWAFGTNPGAEDGPVTDDKEVLR